MTTANADARSADAWADTKERIRQRWPGLDQADVDATQGDRSALVALLQARMGYARPNAEQDLDEILAGEAIIPKDVADDETHTGTSGPVGPVSDATDFTGSAPAEPHRGDLNAGDHASTPADRWGSGSGAHVMPTDTADNASDAERAEGTPSTWPYESRGETGAPPTTGVPGGPDAMPGWGGGGSGGDDRRSRWRHMGDSGGRMPMLAPPKVIAVVGAAGTLLVIGILVTKRRQHKKTRSEQVAEQARHLLDEISERMPSVEELREKVRSFDELRDKKMARR